MAKNLFKLLVVAMALVACNKESVIEVNQGDPIVMRSVIQTRGSAIETSNLTDIWVSWFDESDNLLFDDVKFSKQGDGSFTSDAKYYWDGAGKKYTFYAYAPMKTTLGDLVMSSSEKKLKNFGNDDAQNCFIKHVDFISTDGTDGDKSKATSGLGLTFKHRLSQIEVQGKNTNANYTYEVTGVRIGMAETQGDFDFTTGLWTVPCAASSSDKAVYEENFAAVTLEGTPKSLMGDNGNAYMVPQQLVAWNPDPVGSTTNDENGSYLSVKVKITTKGGGLVYNNWASVPIDTNWEQGKKYTYVLDFSNGAGRVDPDPGSPDPSNPTPGETILGKEIKFSVTVENWTDAGTPFNPDIDME